MKKKIEKYKIFNKLNLDAVFFDNKELIVIRKKDMLINDYAYPRNDVSDIYFIDYEKSFIENQKIKMMKYIYIHLLFYSKKMKDNFIKIKIMY